jgi:predicted ester cyclase
MESSLSELERENETLAHRFHMDIFKDGKLGVADEILSPNFLIHNPVLPTELKNGPEDVKKFASTTMPGLTDPKFVHEDTVVKGDNVLIRGILTGTNTGEMFGNPPTGKPLVITGFDLFRISGNKIVEMWQQFNFGNWTQ